MAKVILKYEAAVLKEIPLKQATLTIGRTAANDLPIDNLAVSGHHAKIYYEGDKFVLEDLNSLNGTFVNNQRIQKSALRHGDKVTIGKHEILVRLSGDSAETLLLPSDAPKKFLVPKVEETMVLDTKRQREMIQQAAQPKEGAAVPIPARARVGRLVVLRGKTDLESYLLSSKLTVIGKSQMASVRLKGWFKPKAAATINKREDGYYISQADRIPKVNGQSVTKLTKLSEGDTIEVAGVTFSFLYSE
jgi:predicted component of type VI protein secretion system